LVNWIKSIVTLEVVDMFGLQPAHIVLIAAAALILFGPKQLPELGKGLGRAITEFKKGIRETPASAKDKIESSSKDIL
jgi:sec-independent protein translocase protein TatA